MNTGNQEQQSTSFAEVVPLFVHSHVATAYFATKNPIHSMINGHEKLVHLAETNPLLHVL